MVLVPSVAYGEKNVARGFEDLHATSLGPGHEAFQDRSFLDADLRYLELVDIRARIVLGVGDRRLEHLPDDDGALLRAELQDVERVLDALPPDEIGDEPSFLRREAHAAQFCRGVHVWRP